MLNCQKDKFSIPEGVHYINMAYMSPLLKSVEKAGFEGVGLKSMPWKIKTSDFFEPVEKLKQTFSKIINCPNPQRIAVIPSVSYGIANVVKNIPAQSHHNIILADEGFPSNYYSWKRLADQTGATITFISPPKNQSEKGKIWNENILNAINENTIAVSLGNVHWADGTLFDLKKIRAKTDQFNAFLIVDGTQSVGAYPLDIQEVKLDALICASYKWLLGAYSFGVAYFGEKLDNGIPIEESWMNRLDSHQFENLVNYQAQYKPSANKYMMGEFSNFIAVPILQTALEQILEWGVANIQSYCKNLTEDALNELKDMGCQLEADEFRCAHLFGIRLSDKMNMEKLKENFQEKNIFVSQRGNAIRVAPHLYNTPKDLEILVGCFKNSYSDY